jgi:hypothetical protein
MLKIFISFSILAFSLFTWSQKSNKAPIYFAEPIMVDSNSTVIIPTRYDSDLLTSSKFALWSSYYANIIFYDFNTDVSKRLFSDDTFIRSFTNNYPQNYRFERPLKPKNVSSKWIFYFVTPTDYNKSGRIDNDDPCILYVSDKQGNELKALTSNSENAVSIEIYEDQNFALVKMQRDEDANGDFESNDKDYYYVRLNLDNLTLGNKIEMKSTKQ